MFPFFRLPFLGAGFEGKLHQRDCFHVGIVSSPLQTEPQPKVKSLEIAQQVIFKPPRSTKPRLAVSKHLLAGTDGRGDGDHGALPWLVGLLGPD